MKDRIGWLKEHFSDCFDQGGDLDLSKLSALLENNARSSIPEEYQFSWVGKSYAKTLSSSPVTTVLSENTEHNSNADNKDSQNILIKGDNLEGLKHLLSKFSEQVGMIYIDPPYNTGKNNFVYQDSRSFKEAELTKLLQCSKTEARERLRSISKDSNAHSAWLTFIYPRLSLAQKLLRKDGVIFISIDDNEEAQLRLVCNEIFGEQNFISRIVWHNNRKGRQQDAHIKGTNEAILVYAKDVTQVQFAMEKRACKIKHLQQDSISQFEKGYPLHNGTADFHINNRPTLAYSIYYHPETTEALTIDEKVRQADEWCIGQATRPDLLEQGYLRIIPKYNAKYANQRVWRWSQAKFLREYKTELLFLIQKDGIPYFYGKNRLPEHNTKFVRFKNYIAVDSGRGKIDLKDLEIPNYFEKPKPLDLIVQLLEMLPVNEDMIVLDFFAGSGTTAQAVMKQNAIDGGKRRWILVQIEEEITRGKPAFKAGFRTISELTKHRIGLGAEQIRGSFPDCDGDLGFRYFGLKSK